MIKLQVHSILTSWDLHPVQSGQLVSPSTNNNMHQVRPLLGVNKFSSRRVHHNLEYLSQNEVTNLKCPDMYAFIIAVGYPLLV